MSSAVEEHVIYQIANAMMRDYPYPHMYVENVFPDDFYRQLRANWPDDRALVSLADTGRVTEGAYPDRFVLPFTAAGIAGIPEERQAFWHEFKTWFMGYNFLSTVLNRFGRHAEQRFGDTLGACRYEADALLVRDRTNYAIGPHTDAPHRLLSMLFYCPDDDSMKHLGTSIYVPLDRDFRCPGGPHHPHKRFCKVITMEYRPNTLFAFFKTDHSFHGVDPIKDIDVRRDILLYDIRVFTPQGGKAAASAPGAKSGAKSFPLLRRLFGS